jgi:hypothetical protein
MRSQASYSLHAQSRLQSRGIPPLVIELLLDHGEQERTRGGFIRYFTKASRRRVSRALGGRRLMAMIEPFLDCYVIEGDNGRLVTAGHRYTRIPRN